MKKLRVIIEKTLLNKFVIILVVILSCINISNSLKKEKEEAKLAEKAAEVEARHQSS